MTRYIDERRDMFGVEPICRVLEVPVSTFYARRSRVPSARELADRELVEEIQRPAPGTGAPTGPARPGRSSRPETSRSAATMSPG